MLFHKLFLGGSFFVSLSQANNTAPYYEAQEQSAAEMCSFFLYISSLPIFLNINSNSWDGI